ncbi:MAG: ATPase, T2SS/T4P/T4SS family [Candidatus Omnitrophota bacterium]|jgi:type II secretory ATPase GspE/PulE/Tfp pilus assembly ATPase PilB-like protein
MTKIDSILFEALIARNVTTRASLEPLVKEAESMSLPLCNVLLKHAAVPEKTILHILSENLKLRLIDFKGRAIDKAVIAAVPVKIASYYKFMPFDLKDRVLTIAVSMPLDIKIQDEISMQLGYEIEIALAVSADILSALKEYYGLAAETLDRIVSQISKDESSIQETTHEKVVDIAKLAEDASIIKLVNQIILEGWRKRATDIHVEPYRDGVVLRYRIDGLLYDANVGPEIKSFIGAIISRIKIMSNLNIVERRMPQDGRAVVKVQEQVLDLRISTIPTPFGESVVIRILPTQMLFSLEKLGLAKRDLNIFEGLIRKPHGIIFVTGPTGSGKTTSLYASLSRINTRERKIITIEDPIEYEMSGVTQIQVMSEIGLDFARGLRSILRHDPDVIMVGEVRDLETAEIAIRVALTGHLVFSTLHTNDAASGITRLVDIGLEPYLVASSVEAFIAQRLIRLICLDCKYEQMDIPEELKETIVLDLALKSKDEVRVFRGRGCANCNFTGFWGRTAIYEILLIDDTVKDLILNKSSAGQIKKFAVSRGMRTLRQDGWQKTIQGLTTPEEVMNVTSAEEHFHLQEGVQDAYGGDSLRREMEKPSDADKRVYSRLNSRVNLRYKIFQSQEELMKQGYTAEQLSVTTNISAGGLTFGSVEMIPAGAYLELMIELPDNDAPIECLAKVIRSQETQTEHVYNVAICFLDMTGVQRARLDKYIEQESK